MICGFTSTVSCYSNVCNPQVQKYVSAARQLANIEGDHDEFNAGSARN